MQEHIRVQGGAIGTLDAGTHARTPSFLVRSW